MTAAAIQTQIDNLKTEARLIQREQSALIRARRNPARFGQLERRLENEIYPKIDSLLAQLATAVDCICGEFHAGDCEDRGQR